MRRPVSPCVKLCRIETETGICEGCNRSLDEIARWSQMSEAEKEAIWARLETTAQSVPE
jgi:hypothetical protein